MKQVKTLVGFTLFFRSLLPNLAQYLMPWFKLLRKNVEFLLEDEQLKSFDNIEKDLLKATEITIRLTKPGQQFVILRDASYYSSGFVLTIEDYLEQKDGKKKQAYASVSYKSQFSKASQLKMSTYCKEFLALYFALEYFSLFIWGAEIPVIILTDNKSVTCSFRSKSLHPALWNFMDRVIAYNIALAHILGQANAASDFLSRMQNDPTQSLELKFHESIPMKEIEIDMKTKTLDASMLAIESDQPEQVEPRSHNLSEDIINIVNSTHALQNLFPHLNDLLASA